MTFDLLILWCGRSPKLSRSQTLDTKRLRYAFERLDHDNNGELDYEVRDRPSANYLFHSEYVTGAIGNN